MERTHLGAVHEELQPLGRIHVGEVCRGLYPMIRTHTGEGKSMSPPTKEEGAAEICDELFTTPHSPPSCTTVGEKVEDQE